MTVFGTGYRGLQFQPTRPWRRIWAIAALEFRGMFRHRLGVLAFLLCLGPSIANFGILLVYTGVWQLGVRSRRMFDLPRMNPRVIEFFLTPLLAEVFSLVIFLLLTSLVSCRAIAKDRETHALEIYWTRGIGPRGYFFGKWLGSVLLVGTVFVAAPAIVWLFGVLMAPGWDLFHETIVFIPRLLLGLSLFTAVLTYIAVSFSAIATTANFASILWFFLLLGSAAMVRLLAFRLFQGEWWIKAVDPWDAGKRLVEWICGVAPQQSYSPWVALVSLATVVAVVTLLMLRRLRLNEAVG